MVPFWVSKFFWLDLGSPHGSDGKESAYNAGELGSVLWVGKISWRRKWQPTLLFFPGEFHGQRRLVGFSPLGHKESDTTEQLTHTTWFLL